jgi:hypothetical protein
VTFLDAYELHGPDTMAIAAALRITEAAADSLINAKMDERKVWPPVVKPLPNYPVRQPRIAYAGKGTV